MSLSIPLLLALTGGGSAPAFDPLSLEPHLWLDPSDLSTLFQDSAMTTPVTADGDPVGAILDKSGNEHHLIQATADFRPLYKTSGGLHWLESNGTDDAMSLSSPSFSTPVDVISSWRRLGNISNKFLFVRQGSGIGFSSHNLNFSSTNIRIGESDPDLIVGPTAPTLSSDFIVTERLDGSNSRIAVDNGSYSTGTLPTGTITTWMFFAQFDGSNSINARFSGCVAFDRALADDEIAQLRTYFAAKQGREL